MAVKLLEQILKRSRNLAWIFFLCSAGAIVGLFILIFLDMTFRSTIGISIEGGVEISEYVLVAVAFLGLGYAQLTGGHVRVDFILLRFPAKLRRTANIIILFGLIAFFVLMALQVGKEAYIAWVEKDHRSGTTLLIPTWPPNFVAFLGCGILVFSFLAQLLGNIIGLIQDKDLEREGWF